MKLFKLPRDFSLQARIGCAGRAQYNPRLGLGFQQEIRLKSIFFHISFLLLLASAPIWAETLTGSAIHADGSPAAGAAVAIVSDAGSVEIRDGKLICNKKAPQTQADAEGKFSFEKPRGRYSLAADDDFGYTAASSSQFDAMPQLTLQPRARIEGEIRVGSKPGAGREAMLNRADMGDYRRPKPHVFHSVKAEVLGGQSDEPLELGELPITISEQFR